MHKIPAPDILFFYDTRDQIGSVSNCAYHTLFDGFAAVNSIGMVGGLALFWKKNVVELTVLELHSRFIHVSIVDKNSSVAFFFVRLCMVIRIIVTMLIFGMKSMS